MKKLLLNSIDRLRRKYSYDCLKQVSYCRDEIRGLANQYRRRGYDDEEIEKKIGNYLDEVYNDYLEVAEEQYGLSEDEFDFIYNVMEDIDGPIELS